ncbi:MAG: thioredoxin [Terrimonas sp.]|nr:thioredoxin [Terrimonas sp.]
MQKMLFFFLVFALPFSFFGQNDSGEPLYKKFPTLPSFSILGIDSSTHFTQNDLKKNKSTLIMIFSPDCDHCKKETQGIVDSINRFKKIQIVMATPLAFEKMKTFYELFRLGQYDNIIVGQDTQFTLPNFYKIRILPTLAFYDKKGKLIGIREGDMGVDDILKKFEEKTNNRQPETAN